MRKRAYRRRAINQFRPEVVRERVRRGRLIFAIDVAKQDMVAALTTDSAEVLVTLAWKHHEETPELLEKLRELQQLGFSIEAVMESTATYGDVLRHQLEDAGLVVFQVSGKRVHDSKEVHDGVASLHDAKCAAIIAELHVKGRTSLWPRKSAVERELKAAVTTMDLHQVQYQRLIHQLESWLARHWPEVTQHLALTTATLVALLARIGGPADVAAQPGEAEDLLHGIGRGLLKPEKIARVVASAEASVGLPMLPQERAALMTLASEAHRSLKLFKAAKLAVERLGEGGPSDAIAPVVGKMTAAVLVTEVGDPKRFSCARAYLKAYGLNLKEKSSGRYQGRLSITKRGSGRARQYLWLAVHRWRLKDPLAQAWYEAKIKRDGGSKARAVVGLMRKLVKALYHVARGEPLDSRKLFCSRRLNLPDEAMPLRSCTTLTAEGSVTM